MIPLASYDAANTYQWMQLRGQLLNLRDFHRQKIQLVTFLTITFASHRVDGLRVARN